MSQRLKGKTALITGSAQGIGRALAERLASDGATVAAVDLRTSDDTVEAIVGDGGAAIAFVADPEHVQHLAAEVGNAMGDVDILVNNAGIYPTIPFADLTIEVWRRIFRVNVESMFLTTQAFLPAMKQRGWGRIINVASNSDALNVPDLTHYIASKMAVIGLTRGIATDAGRLGVTANVVAPSGVRTPGTADQSEQSFAALASMQAIPRVQVPEDLAGTVAFLASDDSAFLTGQLLYVDGGMVRSS